MVLLKTLIDQHKYPPYLIFNMDETMLSRCSRKFHVIFPSHRAKPAYSIDDVSDHYTIVSCINAAGEAMNNMLILPLKYHPDMVNEEVNQYFSMTYQENGWINNQIYEDWIKNIFIPNVNWMRQKHNEPNRQAILILDGHGSRDNDTVKALLHANHIDYLTLPAHSSTILQRLDLEVFGVFKRIFSDNLVLPADVEKAETRAVILSTAMLALQVALTPLYIKKGFAKAGICPYVIDTPMSSELIIHATEDLVPRGPKVSRNGRKSISGQILLPANVQIILQQNPPIPVPIVAVIPPVVDVPMPPVVDNNNDVNG